MSTDGEDISGLRDGTSKIINQPPYRERSPWSGRWPIHWLPVDKDRRLPHLSHHPDRTNKHQRRRYSQTAKRNFQNNHQPPYRGRSPWSGMLPTRWLPIDIDRRLPQRTLHPERQLRSNGKYISRLRNGTSEIVISGLIGGQSNQVGRRSIGRFQLIKVGSSGRIHPSGEELLAPTVRIFPDCETDLPK